ncbi:hypothetical protein J4E83_006389 [Alternaria metachromatica]|uniref:uncharacterized protein n=1 Tax=Alternaria metachromatica TaxID=283354 RepID=UPI0020C410E5|nr:uncharacterized protein J4E83_006389 [Alternaria metachromatica]KAI4616808.1 hypothetical protein J4E83_006389 [Alternaria metachromatica]
MFTNLSNAIRAAEESASSGNRHLGLGGVLPSSFAMQSLVPKDGPALHKSGPLWHSVAAQRGTPVNVIIEVGPTKIKYHVQRLFLTHYSDYFTKALSGSWRESEDGVVRLVDIEPGVFNLFLEWLYTQTLPAPEITYANGFIKDNDWLIKLYVFADRFAVSALRTVMNRRIVMGSQIIRSAAWRYHHIIYAFDNLPPTDPLLDYLADRYYMDGPSMDDSVEASSMANNLSKEFLVRFFKRVSLERKKGGNEASGIFNMDYCTYHEHAKDGDKGSCPSKLWLDPKKLVLGRLH